MKDHLSQLQTGKGTDQLNLKIDFVKDLHIHYKKLCKVQGHHDSKRRYRLPKQNLSPSTLPRLKK
jgi:hypothetical protein